jgi:hypothetical protein
VKRNIQVSLAIVTGYQFITANTYIIHEALDVDIELKVSLNSSGVE